MHMHAILNMVAFARDVTGYFSTIWSHFSSWITQYHVARLPLCGWRKCTVEAAAYLHESMSLAEKVAITTDAWTAFITESYVTVTSLLTGLYRMWSCSPAQYQRNTLRKIYIYLKNVKKSVLVCVCSIKWFYILNTPLQRGGGRINIRIK